MLATRNAVGPGRGGGSGVVVLGALVAVGASVALIAYPGSSPWGTIGLPIVLAAITIPVLLRTRLARVDGLGGVLCLALAAKFLGGFMRYIMVFDWYDGGSDSVRYLQTGSEIADKFRSGLIGVGDLLPTTPGTLFIDELSGTTQSIVGSDAMANFMLFAWLGFIGLVCFVAAARLAVPNLIVTRYAYLVLFLPTTLFWSSSVGKDAVMTLGLGLFSLGAAQLFVRRIWGLAAFAAGITIVAYIRPHLALIALGAFAVAIIAGGRVSRDSRGSGGLAIRGVGVAIVVIGFSFAVSQASGLIPGFGPDGSIDATTTFEETSRRSEQGGSAVEVTRPNAITEYPMAFVTVMFRPLPFEIRSATQAFAAAESTLLLGIAFVYRRSVAQALRQAIRQPYLMMSGLYTLAFAFAWSSVGNLGIIARQRVQVIPFLVLFLAIADSRQRSQSEPVAPETGDDLDATGASRATPLFGPGAANR